MFEISKRDAILLCLLAVFCLANNFIWLAANSVPPAWDEAGYLTFSVQYYNLFKHLNQNFYDSLVHISSYRSLVHISSYRPPLSLLLPSPFYALFGVSTIAATMTSAIFWIILLLASYGIGSALQDANAGLMASFFVSMYPELFSLSRYFMEDFPLASMVALGFFFFLKSDGFRSRIYSIAFGVALGLGMLVKWTYFVFIIGPIFLVAFRYCFNVMQARRSGKRSNRCGGSFRYRIANFGIAVATGVLLASVWYLPNLGYIYRTLVYAGFGEGAAPYAAEGGLLGYSSLSYYLLALAEGISLPFFLAFVILTIYSWRSHVKNLDLLLLSLAVPYAIFTITVDKDARLMIPVLPLMAVISAIGISRVSKQRLKALVMLALVFVGFGQYFALTYGIVYLPQVPVGELHLFAAETFWAHPPRNEDWKINSILSTLNTERDLVGKTLTIGILADHHVINSYTLTYYAVEGNYALVFLDCVRDPDSVYKGLNTLDYVITMNGSSESPLLPVLIELQAFFLEHENTYFTLVQQVSMPDESVVSIYRNVWKSYQYMSTMGAQHERAFQIFNIQMVRVQKRPSNERSPNRSTIPSVSQHQNPALQDMCPVCRLRNEGLELF